MTSQVIVYDPTVNDPLSKVRGVGRYIQILRENFSAWTFTNELTSQQANQPTTFINPFFNFLQSPLSIKRIANKQIAVIHDLIPFKYPEHFPVGIKGKFNIFLNTLVLRNYDIIVTDSEASKKDIIQLLALSEDKVKVIYPCLPNAFEVRSSRLEEKKQKTSNFQLPTSYCLYVGDATWNKNLVNLAKAIKEINVTCVFVGKIFDEKTRELANSQNNKWLNEYKEFIKETANDKRFVFPGFIPDEELIELYKNARCNILISRDEGFGFSYLEAASQTCPSVLSEIPTLKEISNSKGAFFAHPEKPDDIAHAIGEMYFNNEIRNTLGNEAYIRNKFYSYSKFVQGWSKILA